ncbi:V-type ATP synthase subunit D [Eubacterium sp. AB3007]|uniref:V-type ATP synthase subunit D n=1 Tax=Eubacterium sp. AB3007 TaxID=1392487 RepID=UPI000483FF18|nr:V-type ATP synthase subunit D [Eubacterium sp. AB3007]
MERMNVNPTRMMLTSLKKRLKTAVRGHKLLEDKRDELMKEFLELARENGRLRQEVEKALDRVYKNFTIAAAIMSQEVMEESLMYPKQGVELSVGSKNIMSVDVPVFEFQTTAKDTGDIIPYGFARTSGNLDKAVADLSDVFPMLLDLAAKEKETSLLAAELEKTRRRVNALEYVMIPRLEITIRYIQMKLDENERGNQTRLIKVKDMMLEQAIIERREKEEAARAQYAQT